MIVQRSEEDVLEEVARVARALSGEITGPPPHPSLYRPLSLVQRAFSRFFLAKPLDHSLGITTFPGVCMQGIQK